MLADHSQQRIQANAISPRGLIQGWIAVTDWRYLLFAGSIHALGFVGLFAITLLPLRAFLAIRRNAYLWHASGIGRVSLVIVAATAIAAVSLSIPLLARVFRCLTETYCGANRASGWIFLAFIGVLYLGFELLSNVALRVARRPSPVEN
ncbi:hypothetical protein [Stenotrophomonas sp.]|uniref:hypothetical protein n=1 Tax=Stenotrophomonas sp. TaxID=69392 RepID=UPI0028A25E99|nr:hypothetical protein [Stenotrophomonas sp.]